MTQDFLESGMLYPPQIHPATGRFETVSEEMNLREWVNQTLENQKQEKFQAIEIKEDLEKDSFGNSYKLDSRNSEDIENQIKNLASDFVPEWNFDTEDPDIGSALALIYARQMKENIKQFNGLMDHYRAELMKLSQVSPAQEHSAQATVLLEPISELEEDYILPRGTEFFAETKEGRILFQTTMSVSLTPAKLRSMFMTSAKNGKVIPLKGDFKQKNYIEVPESYSYKKAESTFSIFDFAKEGLERQAMVFYHNCLFDVEDETIVCKIDGSEEWLNRIEKGEFRFLYYTKEGFLPVEQYRVMEEHILLEKKLPNKPVVVNGNTYSVFVLEAIEPKKEKMVVDTISFSAIGSPKKAEYVGSGNSDLGIETFLPFGERLRTDAQCYIGMDHYFSKSDSRIYMKFHVSFNEKPYGIEKKKENPALKLIKRKPRKEELQPLVISPREISLEYFNGIGWKRLECEQEYQNWFQHTEEKDYELSFLCPNDWKKINTGSYNGRSLRIRLVQTEDDATVCCHMIPTISELKVSYSYEENYQIPQICKVFSQTAVVDVTEELQTGKTIVGFDNGSYGETALYLGFDKKITKGPVGLWWQIEDAGQVDSAKLKCYYSTSQGFKKLNVIDETNGLTRSGIMKFIPQEDFEIVDLEGEKCYWLQIMKEEEQDDSIRVHQISLNAVKVCSGENTGCKGNVEAGSICGIVDGNLPLHSITNPKAAFGGSDADSKERLLRKASYAFSARNRLVTEQDYRREALYFSDNIDKVSVINGIDRNGEYREGKLYIVPLMKDFQKGKESFYQVQNALQQHLLQHSELSVTSEDLKVVEPVFVKVNVEVWLSVIKPEDSLEIQTLVNETLEQYLYPVSGTRRKGWDIGFLPGKAQIMMRLNSLKNRARVDHIMVTAQYEDGNGICETDIDDIKKTPFMVVVNGVHDVHISA